MSFKSESVQRAISVVTMWENDIGSLPELLTRLEHEDEVAGVPGRLVLGLTSLAGWLALKQSDATGQTIPEVLQDIALKAERDW